MIIAAVVGIAFGWNECRNGRAVAVVIPISVIGVVVGWYFLNRTARAVTGKYMLRKEQNTVAASEKGLYLFLFVLSVCIMAICTKSSPLYPFNDWEDADCFFTVGKSIMNGMVMYRDIYEQKGPLLYLMHGVAYLISKNTFLGVYFFEVLACFAFLCICYHTAMLFTKRYAIHSVCITAAFTYSSVSFCSGDSAEEFCLPFLAYALYAGLKALRTGDGIYYTRRVYFTIGITSACVLWVKYTMLGFYIGWFLVPAFLLIKKRNWKQLATAILCICAGVLFVSLPVLLYFKINGAVDSLMQVYFYDNIFKYVPEENVSGLTGAVLGYLKGIHCLRWRNSFGISMIIIGMIFLVNNDLKFFAGQFIASFVCLFITVFWGGNAYAYYSFIFSVFSICGVSALLVLMPELKRIGIKIGIKVASVIVGTVGWIAAVSTNTYMLRYDKMDLPQYQFAQTIMQRDHPTLLTYGCMDMGAYIVCDILPVNKYFAQYNIHLQELEDAHSDIIENGKVDFVISRDKYDFKLYECIDEASYLNEGFEYTYYLYQLKSESL